MVGARIYHCPHIAFSIHINLYALLTAQGFVQHRIVARHTYVSLILSKSGRTADNTSQHDKRTQPHGCILAWGPGRARYLATATVRWGGQYTRWASSNESSDSCLLSCFLKTPQVS